VLLVTHFFPPNHPGGTEAYTHGLAYALRERGHEPFVLCAEDWGKGDSWWPQASDTEHDGIRVRRLRWNWECAPNPFVALYDNPHATEAFLAYCDEVKPDIVHVTSCYSLGAGALKASRQLGLPTLLTLTDFWFLCPRVTLMRGDGGLCAGPEGVVACQVCMSSAHGGQRQLMRRIPPRLVARGLLAVNQLPLVPGLPGVRGFVGDAGRRLAYLRERFDDADLVLAPSRFLLDMFVSTGFSGDRLRFWPHGLDLSWVPRTRAADPARPPVFGYVGQIDPIKGVHLAIEGFRRLPDTHGARLAIFGDLGKRPEYTATLMRLAEGDPRIHFAGPFERSQVAEVFSQLDVLLVPSVWYENAPIVIAEAFAAKRPVVATDLGGMRGAVDHGVNGLLFERGSVDGLAAALQRLVTDPELRAELTRGTPPVRTIDEEVDGLVALYGAGRSTRPLSDIDSMPTTTSR
jgi:glycosyltransferase involved in cell wall biosynthesis